MGIINQPHDKFFKEMFGNVDLAKDFMTNYLPQEVLNVVDIETISPQNVSYIEGNLKESFSDLMQGYDELPQDVKKYIPDYKYLIYDISSYTDEEIKGNIQLKIVIKILKNIFSSDEEFFKIFKEAVEVLDKLEKQEKGIEYFKTFIYYVLSTRNEVSLKDIYDLVKEVSVERSEDIMTIADKLRKEGMEKGIEKGIEKGKLEGKMEEKIEVARNLLSIGVEIDKIMKATGLSEEDVKKLLS